MTELMSVPLKKPSEVDIVKPLKNLIASTYSTADKPEDYSEQILELSKLRSNAIWKAYEKNESSLDLIYRYYDQLHALEAKIPPSEVQIPFKWKDAFCKGSIFVAKISLTVSSLSYERLCILFNIGALHSAIAASQNLTSDEGLKLAVKLFQQSSGIFQYLKTSVISAIQVDPTPDLSAETLAALSALMLAQAQEVFFHKAIFDRMKEAVVAKLCAQCTEFYAEAMVALQKDSVRNIIDKDWVPLVAGKQAAFIGLAHYFQSIVAKNNKHMGEEIARLQKAQELIKCAQQRSSRTTLFADYLTKIEKALAEAIKDNDFIYHDRVPDPKSLAPIQRAPLVKALPLPQFFSQHFKDLFEDLVPLAVHQALAAYDLKKNELMNREINELRAATQLLNGVLASLNLPAAIEETSGESVPQSLCDKSQAIINAGGIAALEKTINELPELLKRNTEIVSETQRMLDEEESSDSQLKEQFGEKWNRTPSAQLTSTLRFNLTKYQDIINSAVNADKLTREKFDMHKKGIALLSQGVDAMKSALPLPGSSGGRDTDASRKLKQLMEEVETLKAERDAIECELKSPTTDMKETFLMSLADQGHINETVLSTESLGKAYGPLQQQVKDSIAKQQNLLSQIQETNTQFVNERSGSSAIAAQRETLLKELAQAHDAYMELQEHLKDGTNFYNNLTEVLLSFQNKVADFCFARKTEKEELLKDLTQGLSRTSGSTPSIPKHHADAPAPKKEPPARPPPPQFEPTPTETAPPAGGPPSLPYPVHANMPTPYAPPPQVPYPQYTPLPGGYNPYATMYPPQHPGAYPQQQYGQPMYYGTYPGHHPQQPPQYPPRGPW
ncbi:unnamed protein product [Nesidiocoris tenuis]|uniref:Programmed cell death 6-interacting protein n=2 Tax=Nesidiocoris tenuis TaxID=355587 RepID=A0ABN7AW69_9HEMI|nr:programmed cell death 6-interacting protein [Nesidiocoris tenuis]CAA9993346.1 unnamed protein product [Nesidiocoris tenuis]